ncbi:Chitinase [Myxococcus hansupus]|uniref:Chitinase n=1 Tax=Pseudomyxococcus hansupus TaxID=1297742 RepID=A0A0H4X475_9BACT|nr:right-handed parallel beta-helix repeat-containing protein [Myxococcus hansupus]AKQ68440.1 Chitinase [Myxococcus hansupus]
MKSLDTPRWFRLVGLILLAAVGCSLEESPPVVLEPSSAARVWVVLPRSLAATPVVEVRAALTPSNGAEAGATLGGGEGLWQGLVRGVGSGEGAQVSATVVGEGREVVARLVVPGVALKAHRTALAVLVPRPVASAPPPVNRAPFIDAVLASLAEVPPGGQVSLRAVAEDAAPGGALAFAWRASDGSFSDATQAAPVWTAPGVSGPVSLTLQVTNAAGASAVLDFALRVARDHGFGVEAESRFNRSPLLVELAAQPSREVPFGDSVQLQAQGWDDDGDTLTYVWTASCDGTFDDAGAASPRFTPASPPEGACGACRLRVSVRDDWGGAREESLDLCVVRRLPPVIVSTAQSQDAAVGADVVRLQAVVEDPLGEALTFAWTTNTGLLGPPSQTGSLGEVRWSEPSCVPSDREPTVRLTVTNASGMSATHTYVIRWEGRGCGAFAPCSARMERDRVVLTADCMTEGTVHVPDGYTYDGAGHVVTAVDPEGGRFLGAVLRNRGTTAHVHDVTVDARGLAESACDGGEDALSGIRFTGASGSITDSRVWDLRQNAEQGACQEGVAIEVRNAVDAAEVRAVEVLRNHVSGYQKAGIVGSGQVVMAVDDNAVEGGGPSAHIARVGILFSSGATGRAVSNRVVGHAYTGAGFVASGILVVGGPHVGVPLCQGIVIRNNTVEANDIGIDLSQAAAGGGPLAHSTELVVVENTLHHDAVVNGYPYQAAISDLGGANLISRNRISGAGYDRATVPGSTFDVDVVAGAAEQVAFLTPARELAAGACSEALVVQSQDPVGNLAALASTSLVVEAQGAVGNVSFFRDAACTQSLPLLGDGNVVSLEGPQQESVFYFRAEQAGALEVRVWGDGVSATQSQVVR